MWSMLALQTVLAPPAAVKRLECREKKLGESKQQCKE